MNYVSLCRRLAVCTALGIALSLPVGAVWNTMQPQLAYACLLYTSDAADD